MGKKLDIIKEAIKKRHPPGAKVYDTWDAGAHKDAYHRHMSDHEDWNYEGMNSNDEDYDHRERCYDRAEEHKDKADFHARRHFELTGNKISQPDRKLRKKSNPKHVGESLDENKASHADMAAHYDGEVAYLKKFRSKASEKARWYRGKTPEENENAYREHLRQTQAKADHHRSKAELGEAFNPVKSFKRGASGWDTTFPRFNDMNDVSKGTNHGRPNEVVRNTRNKSDEFLHSIHKRSVSNPDSPAGLQQRVARNELERRRKSGKLDPKFHIKQDNVDTKRVYGEAKEPKAKGANARIQAWHWMGAKKAMGAKYGFDHNVPVNQIPTSMEHNGKTVNPRRSVIWVAQQFANKDKAKKSVKESAGPKRFQVLAGGQDSGMAGAAFDDHDEAHEHAVKLGKHWAYKNASLHVLDRETGALHDVRTGRMTYNRPGRTFRQPVGESADSGETEHEKSFWKHLSAAYNTHSVVRGRKHSEKALLSAKRHYAETGKKIDATGMVDGLSAGHEHYLKY